MVGVGANSVDFVNLLPGYPQPFGSFAKMQIRAPACSAAGRWRRRCARARSLGLRAKYVGVTGTDENGRRIRAELQRRDVDITDLIIRDAENQFAVILVDETTGDRIVLWDRDERAAAARARAAGRGARRARASCTSTMWTTTRRSGRPAMARAAGALVTSDIDRLTPRTEELAASGDARRSSPSTCRRALTGHQRHGRRAAGAAPDRIDNVLCRHAGRARRDRRSRATASITSRHSASHAVDTTGAGDVFRGGFIYALVRGRPIETGAAVRQRRRRRELHAARRAQRRADARRSRASWSRPAT